MKQLVFLISTISIIIFSCGNVDNKETSKK